MHCQLTPIRVNTFSIWRLATTMEHRAGIYPTFDPTWYGPMTIVMAGLETAFCVICASVPVFWSPLSASASRLLGRIFVTKEIHATTEHRFDNLAATTPFSSRKCKGREQA